MKRAEGPIRKSKELLDRESRFVISASLNSVNGLPRGYLSSTGEREKFLTKGVMVFIVPESVASIVLFLADHPIHS